MKRKIVTISSLSVVVLFSLFFFWPQSKITIHTLYGDVVVHEPLLCELINSKAFNRLKGIRQYGVDDYIHQIKYPYNRYIHSLGVFALLRKYGAPLEEQVAGLLHDVSHTVFSHVGDHVAAQWRHNHSFNQNDDAYQDNMHCWYLKQTDIAPILEKHGIRVEQINHKGNEFHQLEADLPDICADRLEYNLYGGYIEGWLDEKQVNDILSHLAYKDGKWCFDDPRHAALLADISIRLCEEIFGSSWNIGSYEWAAKALLRAVELKLITMDDIHFGQDDAMWDLLTQSDDPIIKESVWYILHAHDAYQPANHEHHDLCYISKFRGIDPWIAMGQGCRRLSEIDDAFARHYSDTKMKVTTPKYISWQAATA